MSTGVRVPLEDGVRVARELRDYLGSACQRLEVAGSIRRGRRDVGDVELVAEPILEPEYSVFGETMAAINVLEGSVSNAIRAGLLAPHPTDPKNGERYKKLVHPTSGLQVDLFMVLPPASFGVIWLIRTGPDRWSQWLVTHARRRGYHVADGALHMGTLGCLSGTPCQVVPTPHEADVFEALGMRFVQPEDRVA